MTTLRSVLSSLLVVALGACAADDGGDGIDDSFLSGGKADAFGVSEGSVDAVGVIYLVNTATLGDLTGPTMLSANAAKAILHHRQGGDRMDGTSDDDLIDTLEELDGIPYVGPMSFKLLLDQARAIGAVPSSDPFSQDFCKSDFALSADQVRAAVPQGAQSVKLNKSVGGVRVRSRVCVTPDNCPEWHSGATPDMFVTGTQMPATVDIPVTGLDADPGFDIPSDGNLYFAMWAAPSAATPTAPALTLQCASMADAKGALDLTTCQVFLGNDALFLNGPAPTSEGAIGARCAQLLGHVVDSTGTRQNEITFYARY